MTMESRLHTKSRVPVIVLTTVNYFTHDCGQPNYRSEKDLMQELGLTADAENKQLFRGWLTESEIAWLARPDRVNSPTIARVERVAGHPWQCGEGGEYLSENG